MAQVNMTVDQAVAQTYLSATGKTTALVSGSAKYTKILALLNTFTNVWAQEPGVYWRSLRTTFSVPSTVSATDTFSISSLAIGKISSQEGDFVRILHTDGVSESDYTIVPPNRLYDDGPSVNNQGGGIGAARGRCAIIGTNLVFANPFITGQAQIGGTIKIPGFSRPTTLTLSTDVVTVDDPYWLCFMAAAEYIRNDITRVQQYGNLVAQANDRMMSMKENNLSQHEEVYMGGWSPLGQTW